jgi:Na+-transporting methylmalonyl-CoA/oxaloacetate decarboxylase beta subunit
MPILGGPTNLAVSRKHPFEIIQFNIVTPCTKMILVPMLPPEPSHFQEGGLLLLEDEKSLAMELAASSMSELVKMCQMNELLWIRNSENEREVKMCQMNELVNMCQINELF